MNVDLDEPIRELIRALGGVDEAGRGPLAGPVLAAVVVLRPQQIIAGVKDSKQLTAGSRESLVPLIKSESIDWALGEATVAEIDELNILNATMLAMRRAVEGLKVFPQLLRIDGNRLPELPGFSGRLEAVIGGDRLCNAISAASVWAKVHRDKYMQDLDREYPAYGFAKHKGYPTVAHRQALRTLGPCPAHRHSFRPVKDALLATAIGA